MFQNYFNGLSLTSPMNVRLLMAILTYSSHIFFTCYLFEDINEQVRNEEKFSQYHISPYYHDTRSLRKNQNYKCRIKLHLSIQ